jgi:hypothetical protein
MTLDNYHSSRYYPWAKTQGGDDGWKEIIHANDKRSSEAKMYQRSF